MQMIAGLALALLACSKEAPRQELGSASPQLVVVDAPPVVPADAVGVIDDAALVLDAAEPDGECKVDADCELVDVVPPKCCSRCEGFAKPKAEAQRWKSACDQVFTRRSCPKILCRCKEDRARCLHGTCTVQSRPCK